MNFLLPDGFRAVIKKMPTTTFFTQRVAIPGLSLPPVEQGNPYLGIPHTGDHILFEDLHLSFKIDENLKNYTEIFKWLNGTGYPEEHSEYKELADKPRYTNEGLYSDISIMLTTNIKNIQAEFLFRDAYPIRLSGFEVATNDIEPIELDCSVTFKYLKFDLNVINS